MTEDCCAIEGRAVADCPRAMHRAGSRFWRRSKTLTRLLSSALIVTIVLGFAMPPVSGDGMASSDRCDAMLLQCPHAVVCVAPIPEEDTAKIADFYKCNWEIGSLRLVGIEVPPEQPPPIVE